MIDMIYYGCVLVPSDIPPVGPSVNVVPVLPVNVVGSIIPHGSDAPVAPVAPVSPVDPDEYC